MEDEGQWYVSARRISSLKHLITRNQTCGNYGNFGSVTMPSWADVRLVIVRPVVIIVGTNPCLITGRVVVVRLCLMFDVASIFVDVLTRLYVSVFGSNSSSQIDPGEIHVLGQLIG